MKKQTSQLNYAHMTPRKMRLVADVIKGMPVNEAEAQLTMNSRRAAKPLLKLLQSAIAAAKNNQRLNPENLVVETINVDQGPRLKRWLPRARGRATPILKRMSHITLVLKESEKTTPSRFKPKTVRVVRERDIKKQEKETAGAEKKISGRPLLPQKKEKAVAEPGFFRKVFRRKTI